MLITPWSGTYPTMQLFVCSVRARSGKEILTDVHILLTAKKFVTIQNSGIFVYNDLVLWKESNDDLRATLILWNHTSKLKIKVFFQRLSTCLSLLKVHNKRHDYF